MDEKIESLIERGASLLIGLILLLVGLLANVDDRAQTVLLAIGIPLISLATGIQLINSLPHAVVDAKNYVKNSCQQEVTISREKENNTTEYPEWVKKLDERVAQVDKNLMERIEKEAAEPEHVGVQDVIEFHEMADKVSAPTIDKVVFPEEECKPCEETEEQATKDFEVYYKGQPPKEDE